MKFKITTKLNGNLAEAPPFEIEVDDFDEVIERIDEEAYDDYGIPLGVGMTILIERTE